MDWLRRAHDATPDSGVSAGYSLRGRWLPSYPETTGYIMQTFLAHQDLFGGEDLLDRTRRMAIWEAEILGPDGGTPGSFGSNSQIAFNTGQVMLGWAEILKRRALLPSEDAEVIARAAELALDWLDDCIGDEGYFAKGVSRASTHGRHTHNMMTSWGMLALSQVLGRERQAARAISSVEYYMSCLDGFGWPNDAGISAAERTYPLTHAIGYTVQGLLECGLLAGRADMVERAAASLSSASALISKDGFLPGRIHAGWAGGANWTCLTGSAQFACAYGRAAIFLGRPEFWEIAERLTDFVSRTQIVQGDPNIRGGVRGSYPFSFKGYMRVTMPNWAAKFHLDALHILLANDHPSRAALAETKTARTVQ
jgi:hypothetical protein